MNTRKVGEQMISSTNLMFKIENNTISWPLIVIFKANCKKLLLNVSCDLFTQHIQYSEWTLIKEWKKYL